MQLDSGFISKQKRDELLEELHHLQTVERKVVVEKLEFAKSLGDLSENAEYHQAREQQGRLEERIAKIEHVLKNANVVERHSSSQVEIGSTVVIRKEGGEDMKISIVGSEENDILKGLISPYSPLGKALIGKKKGESAQVTTPKGVVKYTIINIE